MTPSPSPSGDLLAIDDKNSVIIDHKDPLAAQGAFTVSSEADGRALRQASGLSGVLS